MKKIKIAYWIFTGLFSAMILMGAGMYLFQTDVMKVNFGLLGFPTWLIYPMAVAKIAGVATLLTRFNKTAVQWAYAGFTFNLLLAMGAHAGIGDSIMGVLPPFLLLLLSFGTYQYMNQKS